MKVIEKRKAVAQEYNLEGFLSAKIDEIKEAIDRERRVELISPTGSGKTTAIKQLVQQYKTVVILLPYNSLLTLYKEFWVVSSSDSHLPQKGIVNVMIYDQAVRYPNFIEEADLVVVDEEHCQFFDKIYRDSAIETDALIESAKGKILFVSATPSDRGCYRLEYRREDKRKVEINCVWSKNNQKTLDELTDFDGKVCVFSNQYFQKSLSVGLRLETSIGVYCSENNENVISQLPQLLKTEQLTKKINFFTSAAFQGLNIRNKESIRVIIMNDSSVSLQAVKQIIGRFREANLDVWVVGKPLKEAALEAKKMIYEAGGISNRLTEHFEAIKEVTEVIEQCSLNDLVEAFPQYDRVIWYDDPGQLKVEQVSVDSELDSWLMNPAIKSRIAERLRLKLVKEAGRKEKLFMKTVDKISEEAILFRKLTRCSWNSCIRKAEAFKNVKRMTEEEFTSLLSAYKNMIEVAKTVDKTIEKQLFKTLEELSLFRSIDDLNAYLIAAKSKRMSAVKAKPIRVVSIELGKCYRFESISEFCEVIGAGKKEVREGFAKNGKYKNWKLVK